MNYSSTSLPIVDDWRKSAACGPDTTDLFFPIGTDARSMANVEMAKAICHRCPVLVACRQWALDTHQHHGVWGGMTELDRDAWRRRKQRAAGGAKTRTPIAIYPSLQRAYDGNTLADNNHLIWVGGNEVKVDGVRYSPNQVAWWATRGAAPVGRVFPDCDRAGCVQHLTDQVTREARKAEAQLAA
ncbi:WhiB family transcriptional regulator [Streptomyces sp. NPDC050421]|uniref:WhiB family transcriptional regulator n=1 Tax=Streptomyces sp. NPDC050421 TaxID=3365613 RepID=UPI0037BDD6AC